MKRISLLFVLLSVLAIASPQQSIATTIFPGPIYSDQKLIIEFSFFDYPQDLVGYADLLMLNSGSTSWATDRVITNLYAGSSLINSYTRYVGAAFSLLKYPDSLYAHPLARYADISMIFDGSEIGVFEIIPVFDPDKIHPLGLDIDPFVSLQISSFGAYRGTDYTSMEFVEVPEILDMRIVSTAPVPEPATFLLLGSGLIGLAAYSRKRQQA